LQNIEWDYFLGKERTDGTIINNAYFYCVDNYVIRRTINEQDIKNSVICINFKNMERFLQESFNSYLDQLGNKNKIFYDINFIEEWFNESIFLSLFKELNNKYFQIKKFYFNLKAIEQLKDDSIKIPENSLILPNVYIEGLDKTTLKKMSKRNENQNIDPLTCFIMSMTPARFNLNSEKFNERAPFSNVLFLRDLGINLVGPIEFVFYLNRGVLAKRNYKTLNNEGRVLHYSTKAPFIKIPFIKNPIIDKKNPLYLGLEWELEASQNVFHKSLIKNLADSPMGDHFVMKFDRSLDNRRGFEIATVPATLAVHKDILGKFYNEEYQFHRKFSSSKRTAIHIHIDKKAFTKLSLGKFVAFINNNDNFTFIQKMAGRSFSTEKTLNQNTKNYCRKLDLEAHPQISNYKNKGIDISAKVVHNSYDGKRMPLTLFTHYTGIYVHPETVEVRIFKSTNKKTNLFRKMEFIDCLVRFVKTGNYSLQQMTVYDFVEFCLKPENKKQYPNLLNWLAEKNYVERERVKIKNKHKFKYIYRNSTLEKPQNNIYYNKCLAKEISVPEKRINDSLVNRDSGLNRENILFGTMSGSSFTSF
jgi:hypothetical protein